MADLVKNGIGLCAEIEFKMAKTSSKLAAMFIRSRTEDKVM
jgi:hypothetical protein